MHPGVKIHKWVNSTLFLAFTSQKHISSTAKTKSLFSLKGKYQLFLNGLINFYGISIHPFWSVTVGVGKPTPSVGSVFLCVCNKKLTTLIIGNLKAEGIKGKLIREITD